MPGRRRRFGIRARVVFAFLALLVVAELLSLLVFRQVTTHRLEEQANRDLAASVSQFGQALEPVSTQVGQVGGPTLGTFFDQFIAGQPARSDQAMITYVGGVPYAASAGAPVALDALPLSGAWSETTETSAGSMSTDAGTMRWMAVPVGSGDETLGVFVTTQFLGSQEDALRDTVVTVAAVTVLVLIGACLVAWSLAGRAMRPLRDLATTARSVSTGDDLDARIDPATDDEVGELAEAFNSMMIRLEDAFDSQKEFLDTAGHELRTPITIVRGHLELLDDDPEQRAREVGLVLDELDRMDRLVTDLRTLARVNRPDFLQVEDADLDALIREIGTKSGAIAPRHWEVRSATHAMVRADRQRVTQAVLNVVSNAVHVTDDGSRISITTAAGHGQVRILVTDQGPGIPAADLPTLFERSGRTVRHRPGGTGLGLPITAAIIHAHGGTVSAESELGTGTTVTLTLPVSSRIADDAEDRDGDPHAGVRPADARDAEGALP